MAPFKIAGIAPSVILKTMGQYKTAAIAQSATLKALKENGLRCTFSFSDSTKNRQLS